MICPCCGWTDEPKYNPSRKIIELKKLRSRYTKRLLSKAVNMIMSSIPSENEVLKEYYFYQTISKVEDEQVDHIISMFLKQKSYLQGKGFKYLSAMIKNHELNKDLIQKTERLIRGKPPSVVKIKED